MKAYLKQQPQILTDVIFNDYGGDLNNSTPSQRRASYVIAEVAAEMDIGTFLTPTVYTGTYMWSNEIQLDHTYINQVIQTTFVDFSGNEYYTIEGLGNWYQAMRDWDVGILNLSVLYSYCCSSMAVPWQVRVVYNAGLSSGTVYTPNVLMALTICAQIDLNEMVGYGNEAPGDVGVRRFENMDYAETRVNMIQTAFGTSAKAQYAHKKLSALRKYKYVGMGVPYR